jgi:hypothetical protein
MTKEDERRHETAQRDRHCERSEAIQYCATKRKAGLLCRFAPRDDGKYDLTLFAAFPSLRANGSRECTPDDRLREAISTRGRVSRCLPQGTGVRGGEFDKVGLPMGAGLGKQPLKMRLDGGLRDADDFGNSRHSANLA